MEGEEEAVLNFGRVEVSPGPWRRQAFVGSAGCGGQMSGCEVHVGGGVDWSGTWKGCGGGVEVGVCGDGGGR